MPTQHPNKSKARPSGKGASLPQFQAEAMRYLSSMARQAQAPCKCPGQAGFLASGCIQKNRQFFSPIYQWPRSSHPTSLLNLTAAFRWMECPWGSYFHTPIILAVLSINLLTPPLSNLCPGGVCWSWWGTEVLLPTDTLNVLLHHPDFYEYPNF